MAKKKTETKKTRNTKNNAKDCPPEWVVKDIKLNVNMHTIGWDAATLEARVQHDQIGPGEAVVYVNRAKNRARVIIRPTMDVVGLLMCPVDTRAVIWDSPFHPLVHFTKWLNEFHSTTYSQTQMANLMKELIGEADFYATNGPKEVHWCSSRRRKGTPNVPAATGAYQTVFVNLNNKTQS